MAITKTAEKIGEFVARLLPFVIVIVTSIVMWAGVLNDVTNLKAFADDQATRNQDTNTTLTKIEVSIGKIETNSENTADSLKEIKQDLKELKK